MARILVVEDDDTIGTAVARSLTLHGHEVAWAQDGGSAIRETARAPFDLVLLDLGLPDLDGLAVCREIRPALPDAVIVILTARDDEMDVVLGLESGGDDYLVKPVRLAELHARVRAHLRRAEAGRHDPPVDLGDLTVDFASRRVTVAGTEVHLRPREYDLLARLASQPGTAVSREVLIAEVWDENWFGSTKTLDVHVAGIRRQLSAAGGASMPTLVTLRGHGYRLDPPS
ncbi:response regulator transcription factor [Pseudonocardia sp. N23]|uniref:response regulator transcription factor n=1 Tax=Pseudonocardia sp. N23 TaxID=1987376 RepID=UPI000BFD089E|nr:response regulator transcription factor [Pseudonocardia sp. N23]GAY13064.1 putative two-component regulator [Pseudonocardia sp. N23]